MATVGFKGLTVNICSSLWGRTLMSDGAVKTLAVVCLHEAFSNFRLSVSPERSWVHIPTLPLFYWVATFGGKLCTHIASPVFSAPRNWRTNIEAMTF